MSRAARVLATVSVGYVQLALTVIAGFWLTPFLLRHLGKADFGLWSVTLPIVVYVGLVDFGVITILQRDVAFAVGEVGGDFRNSPELPELVGKTFKLVLWQCPLLIAAAAIAWSATPASWSGMKVPLVVLLISLVISFPLRVNHAILMGLQDLAYAAKVGLAMWILGTGLTVVFILLGWGLLSLAASWGISQVGTQLLYAARVRLRFRAALPPKLPSLLARDAFARLQRGFWVLVAQIAAILGGGSDMLVIAAVLSPLAVVPYALTGKLVVIVTNVPILVVATAQPALTELRRSSSRAHLADVFTALNQAILLMSGFLVFVILVVDRAFVGWWVGSENFAGNRVVLLLTLGMMLNHLSNSVVWTVFAFGYERRMSVTTVITGLVTIVGAIVLVRAMGVAGAPLAAILGISIASLPPNLVTIARETGTTVWSLIRALLPWAWRTGLLLAVAVTVSTRVPGTFLGLAATSIVAACVYIAVMLPLALREPLGRYVRPRMDAVRAKVFD